MHPGDIAVLSVLAGCAGAASISAPGVVSRNSPAAGFHGITARHSHSLENAAVPDRADKDQQCQVFPSEPENLSGILQQYLATDFLFEFELLKIPQPALWLQHRIVGTKQSFVLQQRGDVLDKNRAEIFG